MLPKEKVFFACILTILMIIGTFADKYISNLLYHPNNWFGLFFEILGEWPTHIIATICAFILITKPNKNKKSLNILVKILYGMVFGFFCFVDSAILKYVNSIKPVKAIFLIIIIAIIIILAFKLSKLNSEIIYQSAKLILLTVIITFVLTILLKHLWGRPRYYIILDGMATFSKWYIPQNFSPMDGFLSFPSGHSVQSANLIIVFMLIPYCFPKMNKLKPVFKIGIYTWVGCVMISRIVMGAHFLTDVTFGCGLSIMTIQILLKYTLYFNQIVDLEQGRIKNCR